MTHRGGIAADGKTGDGCGLLLQKPDSYLRLIAEEQRGNSVNSTLLACCFSAEMRKSTTGAADC